MNFNTDILHAEQMHARLPGSYHPQAMAHVRHMLAPSIKPAHMFWKILTQQSI